MSFYGSQYLCFQSIFNKVYKVYILCPLQWSYSNMKFSSTLVGSIFSIRWSQDGTQIAAGGGNGALIFAHIIEQEKTSRNLLAKTIGRKTIELHDIVSRAVDSLDFPDRIIKWELGYGHLVVATPTQVHVYNEKYTNTPLTVLDRVDVKALILTKKYEFGFSFSCKS